MKHLKSAFLIVLILGELYLIVNCIVAIPQMDENNSKIKDISNQLRDEMKTIRLTYEKHLDGFSYDSLTLARYDETAKFIKIGASSFRLKNYLNLRIKDYKRSMENANDLFIYKFNTENNEYDFKKIDHKKNLIIQQFKRNCDLAEKEITNVFLGVTKNINLLHSLALIDTSSNYITTKREFNKMNDFLFFTPLETDYGKNLDTLFAKEKTNYIFLLSENLLKKNSSSLVVILGMLGMSFFGAIISLFRRNSEITFGAEFLIDKLLSILLISIASSLITYLSLQGGITLITLEKDVNLNPYLILCICFAASVYSDEIWLKVKTWFN